MATATCTHPGTGAGTARLAGTRITTFARTLRRRWARRRDVLLPVGPRPAGPWAGADRPDRDRARMLAEAHAAPRSPRG